jgi:hypothetical protein
MKFCTEEDEENFILTCVLNVFTYKKITELRVGFNRGSCRPSGFIQDGKFLHYMRDY